MICESEREKEKGETPHMKGAIFPPLGNRNALTVGKRGGNRKKKEKKTVDHRQR
jgi:hypothetical protein